MDRGGNGQGSAYGFSAPDEAGWDTSNISSFASPSQHFATNASPTNENLTCLIPQCTANPFTRRADLARHMKHVHGKPADQFLCSYRPCARSREGEGFTRKDHFRDHLRSYHLEDIGVYKGLRNPRTEEQKKLLASRRIDAKWWTCAKCLVRRSVKVDGWDCPSCKVPCEMERKEARLKISKPADDMKGYDQEQDSTFPDMCAPSPDYSQMGIPCDVCNGTAWVDSGYGEWQPCAACLEDHDLGVGNERKWQS